MGNVGDGYDNASAECVIGLFKTELINQIGPWKSMHKVEWETLQWVDVAIFAQKRLGITAPRMFSRTCGVHLLNFLHPILPAQAKGAIYENLNTFDK